MPTEDQQYDQLAGHARDTPVMFTFVQGMPLEELLERLDVTARDFAPIPPAGEVEFDFESGRIVGLLRNDPDGWVVVSEWGFRFDGISFVESAPPDVQAICVGFFDEGLFQLAEAGRLRRMFELTVYDPTDALPEEQDLPLADIDRKIPALMALVERLTGVQVEQSWFTGPFPYVWAH